MIENLIDWSIFVNSRESDGDVFTLIGSLLTAKLFLDVLYHSIFLCR